MIPWLGGQPSGYVVTSDSEGLGSRGGDASRGPGIGLHRSTHRHRPPRSVRHDPTRPLRDPRLRRRGAYRHRRHLRRPLHGAPGRTRDRDVPGRGAGGNGAGRKRPRGAGRLRLRGLSRGRRPAGDRRPRVDAGGGRRGDSRLRSGPGRRPEAWGGRRLGVHGRHDSCRGRSPRRAARHHQARGGGRRGVAARPLRRDLPRGGSGSGALRGPRCDRRRGRGDARHRRDLASHRAPVRPGQGRGDGAHHRMLGRGAGQRGAVGREGDPGRRPRRLETPAPRRRPMPPRAR